MVMEQIVIDDAYVSSDLINNRGQKYPHVSISRENIVKPSIAPHHSVGDIFIEKDNSFLKRIFQQYRYKGFYPMLNFVKVYCDDEKTSRDEPLNLGLKCFYWFAWLMIFLNSVYLRIYFYFYPFEKLSDEELLAEFNPNLDWKNGLIRTFEWHPASLRCALALVNDLVYVYSADSNRPINHICCLKNMAQKKVSSMSWHPKREDILAISCENKVLIWRLQSELQNFKQDVQKCLQVIDSKLCSPITKIVFDSEGNTLTVCSPRNATLSLISFDWNAQADAKNYTIRLIRLPFVSPFTSLLWSPDKRRLLAHTSTSKIRIFENLQWTSKCWTSNLSSSCQTSCWSKPPGRFLLFSPKKSSKVFALTFYDNAQANDVGGSPDKSVLILDTSEPHFEDLQLGTHIQQIIWDRNSTRLAISFQDKPDVIAIFGTRLTSTLQLWPLCTIHSEFESEKSIPLLIKYHDYYVDNGTLLSICWSNGVVSHVTIPIDDSSAKMSDIISSPRSLTTLCTSFNRSSYSPSSSLLNNTSVCSPALNKSLATGMKIPSTLTPIGTPRRAQLFSTRMKSD